MKVLNFWICMLLLVSSQQLLALSVIKNIRVWPSPESTRLVFDVSKKIKYSISTLAAPQRIVIEIHDAKIVSKLPDLLLAKTGIKKIRCATNTKSQVRVVLEVEQKFKIKDFILAPNEKYGHRLVLDLERNEQDQILALFQQDLKTVKKSNTYNTPNIIKTQTPDFIVALDAGHGGDDPGAVGPHGTKEKDIALEIAKKLKQIIDKQPGMQAVLIRNGDYYLGFRERMRRARAKRADLFISIHADAYANKNASGASVFTLATNKSSSVAARWLAASENRADLVGGVSLNDRGDMVANVLFDLSQTANFNASAEAAQYVLRSLSQTTSMHKSRVESGGFLVLRSPDIPSILVEAGFISNAQMEQKLNNKDYQHKIASSIFNGIKQYASSKARRVN